MSEANINKLPAVVRKTINFLIGKGLNAAAAIGICGNIKAESGFKIDVEEYGRPLGNDSGIGLCQWSFGRRHKLEKACPDWKTNLEGQLKFLWGELSDSYRESVLSPLKKVPNTKKGAKEAADIFVRKFEIPAHVNETSLVRQANAAAYWDKSGGAKGAKGTVDAVKIFIDEARKHVGSGGHAWVQSMTSIGSQGWCGATMCAVAIATKFAGKIMPKHDYTAGGFGKQIITKYGGTYIKGPKMGEHNPKVQVGDIAEFQYHRGEDSHGNTGKYGSHHVAVVSKVGSSKITVIHGNWSNKYQECKVDLSEIGWFARPNWDKVGGGGGGDYGTGTDTGGPLDLRQAISQLYSSDNYEFIYSGKEKDKKSPTQVLRETLEKITNQVKQNATSKDATIPSSKSRVSSNFYSDVSSDKKSDKKSNTLKSKSVKYNRVFGELSSSPILIQAPYVEVDMNGIKIGGYNNSADKYPNHIVDLTVEKINNKINTYTISMVHQVRVGEDPNIIDSVLSRTGYQNKVKIRYGDSANGTIFKEEEAYVIDVTYNENVASANIAYTIKAVSSVGFVKYSYMSYPAITSKPSTEITKLMYNSGQSSTQLQKAFKGMKNKQAVLGKKLIPTNDAVVNIPGLADASPYDRLVQLVANMRDSTNPTGTYMLSFNDGTNNNSSFKVTEVKRQNTTNKDVLTKNCYTLDVGYPGNTMITSFSLDNDVYWPLYYKYAGKVASYNYDIDYTGKIIRTKVNPLDVDDKFQSKNVEKMNWWEYVRSYPVSASVTIKGLMRPTMMMENVYVFSQIYGQEDLATGLYSIIGQTDSVGGNGCTTTLKLLKVSQ